MLFRGIHDDFYIWSPSSSRLQKQSVGNVHMSAISLVLTLFFIYYLNIILSKSSDEKLEELHIKLIILSILGYSLRQFCSQK